jgi:hypothetical protein
MASEAKLEAKANFLFSLIGKLAPDLRKMREWVNEVKKANPELSNDQVAEYISDRIVWLYTTQGAALALPGAIPGLGTIAQIGVEVSSLSIDVTLMVRNQTYLTFAIAECYGLKGRDILIQDTLICMGLRTNAVTLTKGGLIKLGTKALEANFKKKFPAEIIKAVNKKVGTTIITKYGTKRGGIAIGKHIPFGVGVIVGGGFNYLTMKNFGNWTRKYFSLKVAK